VMGALGVLLLSLRRFLPRPVQGWAWALSCAGLLAFLVLSKSKGPLIAALCALIFYVVCVPSKRTIVILLITLSCAILSAWLFPEHLLRGGFSYRPELLMVGYQKFLQAPWFGVGVGANYILSVGEAISPLEHAHNLYLHMAIQLGVIGLLLWCLLQAYVLVQAYLHRTLPVGHMLCALFCFGSVALLTDGVGPWIKPREEWFTTWLPLFLCLAMLASRDELLSFSE
jgi:O-antigen ligase